MKADIVLKSYFDEEALSIKPYGNGHINDTRLVTMDNGTQYVLQRINKNVFKRPDLLMENYVGVTTFIRKKIEAEGGDPLREVLNAIPAKDGKPFAVPAKNCDRITPELPRAPRSRAEAVPAAACPTES